jgi:Gpi18-like mannosyltransferase
VTPGAARGRWSRNERFALVGLVFLGVAVRAVLLPTDGFRPDLDQFVLWVHGIAVDGIGNAYNQDLAFGPVIAVIWGFLAAIEPAFRTATDASDLTVRVLMKLPATLADFGIAALVAAALWERPRWALAGVAAVLLHPAVIDVSAWWGQYESIYVLWATAAVISALSGRNALAAGFVALAVVTKPQALPLIVPFAAWFWARSGVRGVATAGLVGLVVALTAWLPFLAAGGPFKYLDNLGAYQNDVFNVLSLRAWNLWWLLQESAAGGRFLADDVAVLGPITLRHLGYALALVGSVAIGLSIVRDPRPRTLVLGIAASTLLFFSFLTGMHERYAFAAIPILAIGIADPRLRWTAIAFGVVFSANVLAAIPPTPEIGTLLPVAGVVGVIGSVTMVVLTGLLIWWLVRSPQDHRATASAADQGLSFPA